MDSLKTSVYRTAHLVQLNVLAISSQLFINLLYLPNLISFESIAFAKDSSYVCPWFETSPAVLDSFHYKSLLVLTHGVSFLCTFSVQLARKII